MELSSAIVFENLFVFLERRSLALGREILDFDLLDRQVRVALDALRFFLMPGIQLQSRIRAAWLRLGLLVRLSVRLHPDVLHSLLFLNEPPQFGEMLLCKAVFVGLLWLL